MSDREHQLKERLRAAGLRATAPRMAVLRHLAAAGGPLSHRDVVEELGKWDRATLFRNLNDLANAGLVRRIDVGDHTWRFEIITDEPQSPHAHHPHFVCVSCGGLQCLEDVKVVLKGSEDSSIDLGELEIHLRGVCDDCA